MRKVFFDTNFLIDMVRFKIGFDDVKGIIGPYEPWTFDRVIGELEGLASDKTKSAMTARVALQVVRAGNFRIVKSKTRDVDREIMEYAGEGLIVATNDSELRKNLREGKSKVIYLRSKKHLEMT
jgi:rRNA-processing protein FCF1